MDDHFKNSSDFSLKLVQWFTTLFIKKAMIKCKDKKTKLQTWAQKPDKNLCRSEKDINAKQWTGLKLRTHWGCGKSMQQTTWKGSHWPQMENETLKRMISTKNWNTVKVGNPELITTLFKKISHLLRVPETQIIILKTGKQRKRIKYLFSLSYMNYTSG